MDAQGAARGKIRGHREQAADFGIGPELVDLARKMGRRLEFGASVAGGIPAIIGIQEGLAGDRLYKIAGILNGTCNYILTKMEATARALPPR